MSDDLDDLNDHPAYDDADQASPDSMPTHGPAPGPARVWVRAALIRALRTMAQAAIGVLGTGAVGLMQADWMNVLSVALMGGVLSLLTSIAGIPEVDDGSSLASITGGADQGTPGSR